MITRSYLKTIRSKTNTTESLRSCKKTKDFHGRLYNKQKKNERKKYYNSLKAKQSKRE